MKNNLFFSILKAPIAPQKIKTNESGTVILDLPPWVGYSFGTIFILLGIIIFSLYPKAKFKSNEYKKKQLIQYNKDNNTNVTNYENTKLFLPFWEKIKYTAPIFLSIIFVILGISWIVGNALTTKNF